MTKAEKNFFETQTPSSRIKANIVAEYFPQYCRIILKKPQNEIRYLDLFAGPGKYEDGNFSTPLLLANACANDTLLSQKVHLLFNDNQFSSQLQVNFNSLFPKGTFLYDPKFGDKTVGECDKIKNYLVTKVKAAKNPHPTLLFFDPWGYKGIDTLVLSQFLSNWGNEIFLFLNIKRVNAAIDNGKFDELMESLFPTTINELRKDKKYKAKVHERLNLITENLAQEFEKNVKGKLYHCAFKFQEEDSVATSHFIIHFTKHQKGYELVKQIYYAYDNIGATLDKDANYTFDAKRMGNNNDSAINFGDLNIETLSQQLIQKYKGRKILARTLFDEHQPTTKFCGTHYAKTLRYMVDKRIVKSSYIDNSFHKVTVLLNNNCELEFI